MAESQHPIVLLRIAEVCDRVKLARPTVYKRMRTGDFPRPIYPAPRAPRWRSDTLQEWIDNLPTNSAA